MSIEVELDGVQDINSKFVKMKRGRKIVYLIPFLEKEDNKFFLDFSELAKPANNKDRRLEHLTDTGPNFGMELMKAILYADYLKDCNIHERNQYQYGTKRGYFIEIQKRNDANAS